MTTSARIGKRQLIDDKYAYRVCYVIDNLVYWFCGVW